MGSNKTLATSGRTTPKKRKLQRKSPEDVLYQQVEKLGDICRKIYDTGTPLQHAFRMANLTPAFRHEIFAFRRGMFASQSLRTAWRSAMYRLHVEEGIDDSQETTCKLLMGPHRLGQPNYFEAKNVAWLSDMFLMPMNFRRVADEPAEQADASYYVYAGVLPIPRADLEAARSMLTVPKGELTPERADQAFALLEPHFTGLPVA